MGARFSRSQGVQKASKTSPATVCGRKRAPRASWGAPGLDFGAFFAPLWTPKSVQKRIQKDAEFSNDFEPFSTPSGNLAIMEREARETRERASNASKARAEREARTARAGATRQGTEAWREWREPPEDRDRKPARSLMPLRGRCAACAGRLTWERLGHLCPVLGPIQAELGLIGAGLARLGADSD